MVVKLSAIDINAAFFAMLNKKKGFKSHFGKWVLLDFWAFHVNKQLDAPACTVKASKLLRALECDLEKDLGVTDADKERHGRITRVRYLTKRLSQRRQSDVLTKDRTKKREFLLVEIADTKYDKPLDDELASAHQKYATLVDGLKETVVVWSRTGTNPEPPRERNLADPAGARSVTPTASNGLDKEINSDLHSLFNGIINPEILSRDDLLVGSNALQELRTRIKEMGCKMKEEEVREHYKKFNKSVGESDNRIASLDPVKNKLLVLRERFGVPMTLPAMHDNLAAIMNIAQTVPEALEIAKFGGKKGGNKKLVAVVASTSRERLYYNLKSSVQQLVDASVDEDADIASHHVYFALARVVANLDEQAFIDASKLKAKATQIKMDALTQKALICDANLTSQQVALIRQYLIVLLGCNLLQPLSKMKELNAQFFQAIAIDFRDGPRKRLCHYRPIHKLLKWAVDRYLAEHKEFDVSRLHDCHILVGGDHGQGAFRMVATLLFFSKDGTAFRLEHEEDHLVEYIECKKETYEMLSTTIAPLINESLKACGEELVFLRDKNSKVLSIEWGAANAASISEGGSIFDIASSVPVEMFMVGDLAHQLLMQGHEGKASHWCAFCQHGWGEWQKQRSVGAAWTMECAHSLLAKLQQMQTAGKKIEPSDQKGLTHSPLLDAMPLENYLVPILHAVDLFANSVKDLFDLYIDHRLENRSVEVLEARALEADQKNAKRKAFDDLEIAKALLDVARENEVPTLIAEAEVEVKIRTSEHKKASTSLGKAAAAARKIEKKKCNGAMAQTLRQEIDGILADEFHIHRSSYHGGDYEGNHCRKLMRRADAVFNRIRSRLLEVPREQRALGCDDEEINKCCGAFKRLFQHMDALSHFCYQPRGSITDSQMSDVKRLVHSADALFRKLSKNTPPKVHAWSHLLEQLDRLRGMKCHHESKIEVSHQVGRKTDLRFRAMAGCGGQKKIKCTMQCQANLDDVAMQARQDEIHEQRRRKFSKKTKDKKERKELDRDQKRAEEIRLLIDLPEIRDEFPSLLELTAADRRAANRPDLAEQQAASAANEAAPANQTALTAL